MREKISLNKGALTGNFISQLCFCPDSVSRIKLVPFFCLCTIFQKHEHKAAKET